MTAGHIRKDEARKRLEKQETQAIAVCFDKMIADLDEASASARKAIEHCTKKK